MVGLSRVSPVFCVVGGFMISFFSKIKTIKYKQ